MIWTRCVTLVAFDRELLPLYCIVAVFSFLLCSLGSAGCVHCLLSLNKQLERDLLKSGVIQVLPYRDRAGRKITAVLGNFGASNHSLKQKVSAV